jgi:maleamate amidohydrolase
MVVPEHSTSSPAFNGRLTPGRRPALLLVDLVNAYFTEGSPLYGGEGCLSALVGATTLLGAARAAGIPIIHTCVQYQSGGRDGGIFIRKVPALHGFEIDKDPTFGAFPASVAPLAGETLVTKQYASAFFGTTVAATLTALQVDTLLIGGVSTSGCVRATAVDACQHGFIPWVVRDAVGDRAREPHDANLFDLQAKYAEVVDLGVALQYLQSLPPCVA